MARACQVIGAALAALGIALAVAFAVVMIRDDAYRQAKLAYTRNNGNAMYELEFRGAQVRRAFQGVGVVTGVLLALNGSTLLGLGILATRTREPSEPPADRTAAPHA